MDFSADQTTGAEGEPSAHDHPVAEPQAPPPNPIKIAALRRLQALERRGKTVGTHLDELRALLTVLFEMLPD